MLSWLFASPLMRLSLAAWLSYSLIKFLIFNQASPNWHICHVALSISAITFLVTSSFGVSSGENHDQLFELLLVLTLLSRQILDYYFQVPGPLLARHTFIWTLWHLLRGSSDQAILEAHRKYGSIVRISPYEYSISNPGALVTLVNLSNNRIGNPFFAPVLHNILSMSQAFAHQSSIDACNDVLLERLADHATTGKQVRLSKLITCYVWDMMAATTVGERFGFMDPKSTATDLVDKLEAFKFQTILNGSYFRFYPWIKEVLKHGLPQKWTAETSLEMLVSKIVEERLGNQDDEAAAEGLWSTWRGKFDLLKNVYGSQVLSGSARSYLASTLAVLLATADPVSAHIFTTLAYLALYPEAQTKIRQEVTALGKEMTLETLMGVEKDLPFLDAVLRESERMKSSNGEFAFVQSSDESLDIGKYRIPPACIVRFATYTAQRDIAVFGDDADVWRPDRWLGDDKPPSVTFGQPPTSDFKKVSTAIVSKVVLQILEKFDLEAKMPRNSSTIFVLSTEDLKKVLVTMKACSHVSKANVDGLTIITEESEEVQFLRSVFNAEDQNAIIGLIRAKDRDELLSTFTPIKTNPIFGRKERADVHDLVRRMFHGKVQTSTDRDTSRIGLYTELPAGRGYDNRFARQPIRGGRVNTPYRRTQATHPYGSRGPAAAVNVPKSTTDHGARSSTSSTIKQSSPVNKVTQTDKSFTSNTNQRAQGLAAWNNFGAQEAERQAAAATNPPSKSEAKPVTWKETFKSTKRSNENDWFKSGSRKVDTREVTSHNTQPNTIADTDATRVMKTVGNIDTAEVSSADGVNPVQSSIGEQGAKCQTEAAAVSKSKPFVCKEKFKLTQRPSDAEWCKSSTRKVSQKQITLHGLVDKQDGDGAEVEEKARLGLHKRSGGPHQQG